MQLNVNERLVIVGVIPEKGTFKTMSTVEKLRKILHLSEEEVKEYELVQKEEQLSWNKKGIERKEIEISELGMEMIMDSFDKLDKAEELIYLHQYPVYKYLKEEKEKAEKEPEKE
jgi:predicted transcriptional regulator YheO